MKKTGEILRKAREEKGLSLNEIGLSLKISSKVLKAIEEGNEKHLPAKTFLRGFVQSYANYLHLDTDKILEMFYEEMGSTRPKPYIRENDDGTPVTTSGTEGTDATVTPISSKAAASRRADNLAPLQQTKNTKTVAAVIVGFILVALIIFTKKMIDKYSKEAEVPTAEVEQTMEGATPVSPTVEGETAPVTSENQTDEQRSTPMTSQATPAPSAVTTPLPSVTPVVTPKASPSVAATPTPKPSASPTPVASATATPSPSAVAAVTPTPKPSPTASPTPAEGKPVELIVEALDNVEIEYSAPNGKVQKIKLSAEQVHTFKSKSGLKINFSNGGAVNLILNGKEIGIPGDLGKAIKLSY